MQFFLFVSQTVIPLVVTVDTSQDAWSTFTRLFANCSWTRVMQLQKELVLSQHGIHLVSEFLHSIKATIDELALINTPLTNDNLTLHVLNGLGAEFHDIVAIIRARETSLTFKELHDLLIGHEAYLKHLEIPSSTLVTTTNYYFYHKGNSSKKTNNRKTPNKKSQQRSNRLTLTCQLCDRTGHIAKQCLEYRPVDAVANCATING